MKSFGTALALQIFNQPRNPLAFLGGCRFIQALERPIPLAAADQGARIAQNQQTRSGASHRNCQLFWVVPITSRSVRMASSKAQYNLLKFSAAEGGGQINFKPRLVAQRRVFPRQLSNQLNL